MNIEMQSIIIAKLAMPTAADFVYSKMGKCKSTFVPEQLIASLYFCFFIKFCHLCNFLILQLLMLQIEFLMFYVLPWWYLQLSIGENN